MTLNELVKANGGPLQSVYADTRKEVARDRNGRFWLVVDDGALIAPVEVPEPQRMEAP